MSSDVVISRYRKFKTFRTKFTLAFMRIIIVDKIPKILYNDTMNYTGVFYVV